MVEKSKKENT